MFLRLFLFAVLPHLIASAADPKSRTLQIPDSRRLVYASLSDSTKRLPGLDVVPGRIDNGRCVTFDVLWNNPGVGSAHVAFYTVDIKTAAVWTGVTGVLSSVSNPRVARLQMDFRRRLKISDRDYRSAVEKHPCGY